MQLKEVVAALFEIEERLDLFGQRIDGVYFWERVRVPVYIDILQRAELIHQPHTRPQRTLSNRGRSALRALKNVAIKNPYLASKNELLFLGSARRKLDEDGKWWDIYCDPIIDTLNRSYVYFEPSYLVGHYTPAKTKHIRYLDLPLYLAAVKRKVKLVRVSLTRQEMKLLKAIRDQIHGQFKVQINLDGMVQRDLLFRRSVLPAYQHLLRKVSPRLVFIVCSYGRETVIEACKTVGVPAVELQHGIITSAHLGYSFPGPKRTKRAFPDYLFLFGDLWKENIDYPIGQERIFSVGYPYHEREVKKYSGVNKQDQVLFISQGTVGVEMSRFAVELSQRDEFPFSIVYKLHPGEYSRWRTEYPWLAASGIRVVEDDSIPLYQLLAESRVQVGLNSTALLEGLSFGLRTFLLDQPGIEHMEALIKSGVATVISSVDDLVEETRQGKPPEIHTEHFFRPNALNNVTKAIDKLLAL